MYTYVNITPITRLPRSVEQTFTYHTEDNLQTGQIVLINFHGRKLLGVVRSKSFKKPTFKTTSVIKSLPFYLTTHQEYLVNFLITHYAATDSLAYGTVIPNLRRTLHGRTQQFRLNLPSNQTDPNKLVTMWGSFPDPVNPIVKNLISKTDPTKQTLLLIPDHASLMALSHQYPDALIWNTSTTTNATDSWLSVASGAKLVIGTRASLFAPFQALENVIVCDASSDLYRSRDSQPKYNTISLLRSLNEISTFKLTNVQAVPTLQESSGTYLAKLNVARSKLLTFDRRSYSFQDKKETLSSSIINEITNQPGRVLIYANKKGYGSLMCRECEYIHLCPKCELPIVCESQSVIEISCHRCMDKSFVPQSCPACSQQTLHLIGHGIKRIREFLQTNLADRPVIEIDAGTTKASDAFLHLIQTAPSNTIFLCTAAILPRLWILPDIELCILPRADQHLAHNSWRTNEDFLTVIYSLLTKARSKTVIELSHTDYRIIQSIKNDDLKSFWNMERQSRKKFGYPPFQNLIRVDSKQPLTDFSRHINQDSIITNELHRIVFRSENLYNQKLWRVLPDGSKVDVNPYSIV